MNGGSAANVVLFDVSQNNPIKIGDNAEIGVRGSGNVYLTLVPTKNSKDVIADIDRAITYIVKSNFEKENRKRNSEGIDFAQEIREAIPSPLPNEKLEKEYVEKRLTDIVNKAFPGSHPVVIFNECAPNQFTRITLPSEFEVTFEYHEEDLSVANRFCEDLRKSFDWSSSITQGEDTAVVRFSVNGPPAKLVNDIVRHDQHLEEMQNG